MILNFYTIDYESQNGSGQPPVFLTANINWNKYSSTSSLNEVSNSLSNMTISTQEPNSQEASTTVGHFVSKTSVQETVFQETAKYFISTSLVIDPTPTLISIPLLSSSTQSHILSTTFALMPSTSDISSLQSISTFVVYSNEDVTTKGNQPTPILLPPITSGIVLIKLMS